MPVTESNIMVKLSPGQSRIFPGLTPKTAPTLSYEIKDACRILCGPHVLNWIVADEVPLAMLNKATHGGLEFPYMFKHYWISLMSLEEH